MLSVWIKKRFLHERKEKGTLTFTSHYNMERDGERHRQTDRQTERENERES